MPLASSTRRRVLILYQLPFDTLGGGETYVLNVARSILANGDDVMLAAPVENPPTQTSHRERMAREFLVATPGVESPEPWQVTRLTAGQLLDRCWEFDYVVVPQFLSSDLVFDVIAALESAQKLILTSLGHEPLLPTFARFYQPCANHHVLSISEFAAQRLKTYGVHSDYAYAGIWTRDIARVGTNGTVNGKVNGNANGNGHGNGRGSFCAIGRVLPHKGYEVAIAALRKDEELLHIGQRKGAEVEYYQHLDQVAQGKNVQWLGVVEEHRKREILAHSRALLVCSRDVLYNGVRLDQSELLGLVVLEAIAAGVLPIASDVPAVHEVMQRLSLGDWVYAAGDSKSLRTRLDRLTKQQSAVPRQVMHAQEIVRAEFSWDSYWQRVRHTCEARPS